MDGGERDIGEHETGGNANFAHRLPSFRFVAVWLTRETAKLNPGCFALVMATGIVSNAFYVEGLHRLADTLLAVGLVAYLCLWLLTILRVARFPAALRADLTDPQRVFLFFTIVAATDVLGTALGIRGFAGIALAMWLVALALWLGLIYLGFGVLIFVNAADRADISEGAWLNGIVGTQSLVILGAQLALSGATATPHMFTLLQMLWSLGLALYGILIVLLSYRIFFHAVKPDDVAPPLWIVMGAAAISCNAGVWLAGTGEPFVHGMQPFLEAVILALWAWATWWIPLLVLLGLWKHGVHGVTIRYTPLLWSIVFPLGMYGVTTFRVSRLADLPALASGSRVMAFVALAAWGATAIGFTVASSRNLRSMAEVPSNA